MTFHPRALLVAGLFAAALVLAVDARLGLATCALALVAYVVIELSATPLGPSIWRRARRERNQS